LRDGQRQSVLGYAVSSEFDGLGTCLAIASAVVRLGGNVGLAPRRPHHVSLVVPRQHFDSIVGTAPHLVNLTDLS
jgi:hypothetical protein